MLGGTSTAYQYTGSSNRLQAKSVGGGSYTNDWAYDNSGNQITKATDTFVYGDENRLSRHTKSGANTDYVYNGLGQRVKKTGPGGTFRYVYDLDGKLLAEYAGASLAKEYLWMGNQLVGLTYNGVLYYMHTDHLGRPEIAANSSKAVVWKADNRAFDRDVLTDSIGGLNLGFPGQYYDSEKDSWYNYFRDYDANTGRYIQSDPIGLNGGMNTYGYVGGNPLIRIDDKGTNPIALGCLVGAAAQSITGLAIDVHTNLEAKKESDCDSKNAGELSAGNIAKNFATNAVGGCVFGVLSVVGYNTQSAFLLAMAALGGLGFDAGLNAISIGGP